MEDPAIAALVTGFLRLTLGAKGADFYFSGWPIYAKLGLFLAVGIISVAQRPHKGTKGYYRVKLEHAISRVRSGERIGLELVLHDAGQG